MQANVASTLLLSWCAGSFGKKGNDRTFDHWVRTTQDVLACVSDEIEAWFQEGFKHLKPVVVAMGMLPGRTTIAM